MPLHIVQRGHNRAPCFFAEEDYYTYLHWLGEALKESGCLLHAFVLMTNHVHLLVTPSRAAAVPKLMISLGRRYVQYINVTYRRTGTLWDSRYKSSLIHEEHYLLLCMRYIELNPVRAGMVADPAHYRWSSYRTNALGKVSELIKPHPVYTALSSEAKVRQERYRALFRSELDEKAINDIRLAINHNQPLGNSRFHAEIERRLSERRQARSRGGPKTKNEEPVTAPSSQGWLDL